MNHRSLIHSLSNFQCLPDNFEFGPQNQFSVPEITPSAVSQVLQSLKPSAGGADAWQVDQLQHLGQSSIKMLSILFNAIEATGTWPEQLLEIPVAALKKPTGNTAMDIRPISLASILYRIWAKIRWQDLQPWYHAWIPSQLKGGIKNREAIDGYYELMLQVESCLHGKHSLFGILYDYTKCFDNVPWTIEEGLLHSLGLPDCILRPMFAFSKHIQRRFKFSNSLGPIISNSNSIMQGCPLAVLRINALIASWIRVVQSHPDTKLCSTAAFIDDKHLRAHNIEQLQAGINLTAAFDKAIDAAVNTSKTALFANSTSNIKRLTNVTLDGKKLKVVTNDKLLGGQMSFTSKRALHVANTRANAYMQTAKRITLCPLSIDARALLLSTAGANKYSYGLELGACSLQLERKLRSTIVAAVWQKRPMKCVDIVLTLCFKGHKFDPVQMRFLYPFKIARRQLLKHSELQSFWIHIWLQSFDARAKQTAKKQAFGPLAILQSVATTLQVLWISPFEFIYHFDDRHSITFHLLEGDNHYFLHPIRLIISRHLWKPASQRKSLASIRSGVDKVATLRLLKNKSLDAYDRGILRSILADAITTQKYLFRSKQAKFSTCPWCWKEDEDLEHLFWKCPKWHIARIKFLSLDQLANIAHFPISIRRAGIFPLTESQLLHIIDDHRNLSVSSRPQWPMHTCAFPEKIQSAMIEIIKMRNQTPQGSPPDDYQYPDDPEDLSKAKIAAKHSHQATQAKHNAPKETHDENGLLLSTSGRPGASKYQHVQGKPGRFRAIIPHLGKRHSFGPFTTDIDAAKKVQEFFRQVQDGKAAMSRGEKRIEKFNTDLLNQLAELNATAKNQKRHFVEFVDKPSCQGCGKSVHRYYALQFAKRQCPALNDQIDKRGSLTRATNVSKVRQHGFSSQLDTHNDLAADNNLHILVNTSTKPYCSECGQTFKKSALKTVMGQHCPGKPEPPPIPNPVSAPRRRRHGKQPPST